VEAVVRFGWALAGIALVAVAGGCTSGGDEADSPASAPAGIKSAPPWTEPASYRYVLTRGCDPAKPLGRYRATVKAGEVTGSENLSAAAPHAQASSDADLGPVTGQNGEEIEVPSLSQLLDMAKTASEDGGEVSTAYDTKDGHPVKVTINVSDQGPAGAECWNVSDYAPAA
jgi:hypothetical protein